VEVLLGAAHKANRAERKCQYFETLSGGVVASGFHTLQWFVLLCWEAVNRVCAAVAGDITCCVGKRCHPYVY
jgi:hypothetical protein